MEQKDGRIGLLFALSIVEEMKERERVKDEEGR